MLDIAPEPRAGGAYLRPRPLCGSGGNAEIARQLIVGEATIKTHLERILAKLGVRDRTQAVITAYETGLVEPGTG